MSIQKLWNKYSSEGLSISLIPDEILCQGQRLKFPPYQRIVNRGEVTSYLYFILSGKVTGLRDYDNGNEYKYFQLDESNGFIGLLEILARKPHYIATIRSITEVEIIKVDSAVFYEFIMNDIEILRRCTTIVAQDLYRLSGNDGILYYLKGIDRMRHYLVSYYDLHRAESERVMVEAEYQEIASQIGVSIRTVGRSIRKLKDSGEIQSVNKRIILTKEKYELLLSKLLA